MTAATTTKRKKTEPSVRTTKDRSHRWCVAHRGSHPAGPDRRRDVDDDDDDSGGDGMTRNDIRVKRMDG